MMVDRGNRTNPERRKLPKMMLANHTNSLSPEVNVSRYMAYLNVLSNAPNPETTLDIFDERLLNFLALVWHSREKITVVQAMNRSPDLSTTTVHRRLKSLKRQGFISLQTDEKDNRIKYVIPTDHANRYFAHRGDLLLQAQL